ncbi:TolC family protein [Gillisia sp. M10.2A]|uniref:TolC family protein n=1 Tax=Gillisia lutea TaxID=2909668 RepID=A0ABS9EDC7_9FLAO|nr:TolC family protein [Gillisia lutea]MCF4100881.1 TolC family protein [Gillisia lutea]
MKSFNLYKIGLLIFLLQGMTINSLHAQETLADYLEIAAKNNPKLKASYAQFEAALKQSPQVASLPDPTLTVSGLGRMIETRAGTQEARFNLMQMFPWFGTLDARKDAANLMAEAKFQSYLNLQNELSFEVKSAYAELYALSEVIEIKKKNLSILDSYRELALSRFKSGGGAMVNVVKVDIEREAALTEIELLEEMKKPLATKFNLLLHREAEVVIKDSLVIKPAPRIVNYKEDLKNNPIVLSLEKQKASYAAKEILAEKEGMPNIGLGVDYSIISKRTDANPDRNGQDAIMPMVSVSLPIFRKKYKAAKEEANLLSVSIENEMLDVKNELQTKVELTLYDLKKAVRLIELYDKQLKSSNQANKLYISSFSNAIGTFEEVLRMNQDILLLQTQKIEAIKRGFIANAKLEYLLFDSSK